MTEYYVVTRTYNVYDKIAKVYFPKTEPVAAIQVSGTWNPQEVLQRIALERNLDRRQLTATCVPLFQS